MIGLALVSNPKVIVLDEPLSGLDSYNALIVTQTLRSLAERGRVVIYSLHQPSNEIYLSLDEAIFMAHGRIVYQGSPKGCQQILQNIGVQESQSEGKTLADYMVHALNDPAICEKLSNLNGEPEAIEYKKQSNSANYQDDGSKTDRSAPLGLQISLVFYRALIDVWRNKSLLTLHVCISIVAGLLAGGLFYNLGYDTKGVQGRYGGIFVSLCFLAFTSLTTVDLVMNERAVVTAEVNSGLYHGATYVVCKLVVDGLLLRALPATLYAIPFYFMAGFRMDASSWFSFLFTLILFSLCIGALSILVVICSNSAGTASFVMNTLLLLQLSFTGFLVNVSSIPDVLEWIHWLSQFFYAFEATIQTELNNRNFDLVIVVPGIDDTILEDTAGEVCLSMTLLHGFSGQT